MICLRTGKTSKAKSHQMNLRSPLPRIHYYHNKWLQVKEFQYLIPTYSWNLTPTPNWTCSYSDNLSFSMHGSQYVTNQSMHRFKYVTNHQLEKNVDCKVFQFINMMKITKLLGYKILRYTNAAASSREEWTRAYVSWKTFALSCIHLYQL